jgi:uncharacterized SAM-binding protein YcdF (DUF218 family)
MLIFDGPTARREFGNAVLESAQPKGNRWRLFQDRAIRAVQKILIGLGLLLLVVTFTPLDFWWATRLAGPWNDPKGDVLIVLGGSVLDDGTIGESSYWRAVYAARAWREAGFKEIVVTGGGPPGRSVAEAIRDFLVAQGVPESRSGLKRDPNRPGRMLCLRGRS